MGSGTKNPTVVVIDDDPSVRDALDGLLRSVGLRVQAFPSAEAFLKSEIPDGPCCLVLDVKLPERSGLDCQKDLVRLGHELPIVFITGHGDIPMSVQAMKGGAVEFLTKPFSEDQLLDAVRQGIDRDRRRRERDEATAGLRSAFASLSGREREVMAQVARGRLNKQIAADLNLSEITIKVHRGHMMQKMAARSLADLIRMADKLGLT